VVWTLAQTDVIKKVEGILRDHDAYAETFSDIGEHAPIAGIRAAMELYTQHGAGLIVSVGGGSPIDASKAIIYNLQQKTGGEFVRQIAVPTTLSAAEYTVGAGFTDDNGNKTAVSSPQLAPTAIILDAELTLATPERLWLSTGMRAVDHAVGEYAR
jgi:alcohol dehydrogenase class IV